MRPSPAGIYLLCFGGVLSLRPNVLRIQTAGKKGSGWSSYYAENIGITVASQAKRCEIALEMRPFYVVAIRRNKRSPSGEVSCIGPVMRSTFPPAAIRSTSSGPAPLCRETKADGVCATRSRTHRPAPKRGSFLRKNAVRRCITQLANRHR